MYLLSVCWLIFYFVSFFSRFCACFISACFFLLFIGFCLFLMPPTYISFNFTGFVFGLGSLLLLNLILLLLLVLFICFSFFFLIYFYFNRDRTISVFRSKHIWFAFFPRRFGIVKNVFVFNVCDVPRYGMAAVRKNLCTQVFNKIIVIQKQN